MTAPTEAGFWWIANNGHPYVYEVFQPDHRGLCVYSADGDPDPIATITDWTAPCLPPSEALALTRLRDRLREYVGQMTYSAKHGWPAFCNDPEKIRDDLNTMLRETEP